MNNIPIKPKHVNTILFTCFTVLLLWVAYPFIYDLALDIFTPIQNPNPATASFIKVALQGFIALVALLGLLLAVKQWQHYKRLMALYKQTKTMRQERTEQRLQFQEELRVQKEIDLQQQKKHNK